LNHIVHLAYSRSTKKEKMNFKERFPRLLILIHSSPERAEKMSETIRKETIRSNK
jgi:hypothetical protein